MYLYGASVFFIGFSFAILGYLSAKTPEKKALSQVLLFVDLIAFFTYGIQSARWTPSLKDVNGYPVDVARFLEWICTCPSLILLIGNVTKDKTEMKRTVFYDYLLLILGFLGACLKEPYSQMCLIGAFGCFTIVISGLWDMFTRAIKGETDCKLDKISLQMARAVTVASWCSCMFKYFID